MTIFSLRAWFRDGKYCPTLFDSSVARAARESLLLKYPVVNNFELNNPSKNINNY